MLNGNKTIDYDYIFDIDSEIVWFDDSNHIYNYISFLYHTNFCECKNSHKFLQIVSENLLNILVKLKKITAEEKEEILNSINWKNSQIHFHINVELYNEEYEFPLFLSDDRLNTIYDCLKKFKKYFTFNFTNKIMIDLSLLTDSENIENQFYAFNKEYLNYNIDTLLKILSLMNIHVYYFYMYCFFPKNMPNKLVYYFNRIISETEKEFKQNYPNMDCAFERIKV